jgi:hypothetical protein
LAQERRVKPNMTPSVLDQASGRDWALYNADTVEFTAGMPANSIDLSVYSPPFSSLYIYSESSRDMGNVDGDEEFMETYSHLVRELLRVTRPGRLTAIHVKDLVYYSNASDRGDRGLRDFTGECIRVHVEAGWTLHSRVTVWRCPVREMQKAKPDGLLFKNFRGDAARVRVGLPEYIVCFRKWAPGMDEAAPVKHPIELWRDWRGVAMPDGFANDDPGLTDRDYEAALNLWQNWASPVWMDTRETDVLNARVARDEEAEKHLCPMPLDLTDRVLRLYSNPGEVVYSPFSGIGSEGWAALRAKRKFVGTELKQSYFEQAAKYLAEQEERLSGGSLLEMMA